MGHYGEGGGGVAGRSAFDGPRACACTEGREEERAGEEPEERGEGGVRHEIKREIEGQAERGKRARLVVAPATEI